MKKNISHIAHALRRLKAQAILLLLMLAALLFLGQSARLQSGEDAPPEIAQQPLTLGKLSFARTVFIVAGANNFLYTSNADGTGQTSHTTFPPYAPVQSSWSPDGIKIAFGSIGDIHVFNTATNGFINLTNNSPTPSETDPAWSSTGKIAYERDNQIWVMNDDGTSQAAFSAITRPTPTDPAWSADGSRLAFASGGDIYVINANGTGEVQVTTGAGVDRDPTWSPDGSRLAFSRTGSSIFVINLNGTGELNISGGADDREPAWSLDDTKIAFVRKGTNVNGIYLMNTNGTSQVRAVADLQINRGHENNSPAWQPVAQTPGTFTIHGRITRNGISLAGVAVNLSGSMAASTTTNVLGHYYFSNLPAGGNYTVRPVLANHIFSPVNRIFQNLNGNRIGDFVAREVCQGANCATNGRIVFARDGSEIYTMNEDGSDQINLTNNAAIDTEPAYSPDGQKIIFSSNREGNYDIYRMNQDGSGITRLTTDAADDRVPSYSPDGSRIVFTSQRDGNSEIYTMNADGSNQVRRTTNTLIDNTPSYSPDGTKIVFVRFNPQADIYTMNADGSNQANLTNQPGFYTRPTYSPNGAKILFIYGADVTGQTNWVMNANGTGRVLLSNGGDGGPSYSPDGAKVVFTCCNTNPMAWGVYVGATDTAERLRLTTQLDLLPDWQPVRFSRPTAFDFDGDTLADIGIYRPGATATAPSYWYVLRSSNNTFIGVQYGSGEDRIVPADYDGDTITDIAVWRPSTGYWYTSMNPAINYGAIQWGASGDIPVPGDFDADGRADIAVFRPSTGYWYVLRSVDGVFVFQQFGASGDKPLIGDFDGDAVTDFAYVRIVGADLSWNILQSSNGQTVSQLFGLATDKPTAVDFDGDGKANIAVFRPSTGRWYTSTNPATNYGEVFWGQNGDAPAPADFDGDKKADVSVFRASVGVWYILKSGNGGIIGQQWGQNGDLPVEAAFIP